MLRKFLQLYKNALSRRDKTISETDSETVVASVSCIGRITAKARQTVQNHLFGSDKRNKSISSLIRAVLAKIWKCLEIGQLSLINV